MRNTADAVIIGGGVNGTSIAYQLAKRGMKNVVVLEKKFLAAGSTGRCGAGVRAQWGTEMNLRLSMASVRMFERMNEELQYDNDIEFHQGGYLLLAYSEAGWEQFKKNVELQHKFGLKVDLLTPQEARGVVPFINIDTMYGATFCPTDGHCNPFKVTDAYAKAAARLGAEISTFTEATAIKKVNGRISAVVTNKGEISTPIVINAAGPYSAPVAEMAGIKIPTHAERHQILVTEPVARTMEPMVMSFHHGIYCQQAPHGSFIMGLGDPHEPKGYNTDSSFEFLNEMSKLITWLLPPLGELRVVRQWSGLYNMTPDRTPIIGPVDSVSGYYQAVGFSGHGFMLAPIAGEIVAKQVLGEPIDLPIEKLNLSRFERGELFKEPSVV
jgi:sarcosine oxidase subunit beta